MPWLKCAPRQCLGIKFSRDMYDHAAHLLPAYLYQSTAWDTGAVQTASGLLRVSSSVSQGVSLSCMAMPVHCLGLLRLVHHSWKGGCEQATFNFV